MPKLKKTNYNQSKKYQFYSYFNNFKDQVMKKLNLKFNNIMSKIKNKYLMINYNKQ